MGRIQKTKEFRFIAVLLVIVMVITSIPVGVYAGQIGGINTGSSTVFSNLQAIRKQNLEDLVWKESDVTSMINQCLTYWKSEVFEGKKAIDFLGYRYSGEYTVYVLQ